MDEPRIIVSEPGREEVTAREALDARSNGVVSFVMVVCDAGPEWSVEAGSAGQFNAHDIESLRAMLHRTIDAVIDRGTIRWGAKPS